MKYGAKKKIQEVCWLQDFSEPLYNNMLFMCAHLIVCFMEHSYTDLHDLSIFARHRGYYENY